jgi:hypothetical protein
MSETIVITKPKYDVGVDIVNRYVYTDCANVVNWTGTGAHTDLDFYVSFNSGSNWTSQTSVMSSINVSQTTKTAIWTPPSNLVSDYETDGVLFKVVDHESSDDEGISMVFTMRLVPIINIRPNSSNIMPIYKDDMVNITWSNLYSAGIGTVQIELSVNNGASYDYIISLATAADRNIMWKPSSTVTFGATRYTQCKIKITGADISPYNDTAMVSISSVFELTTLISDKTTALADFYNDEIGDSTSYNYSWKDAPNVFVGGGELIGEKATYMDAALILGQIESGANFKIVQRFPNGQSRNSYGLSDTLDIRDDDKNYNVSEIMYVVVGGLKYYYCAMNNGVTASSPPADFSSAGNPGTPTEVMDGGILWRCVAIQGSENYNIKRLANNVIFLPEDATRKPRELQTIIDFNTGTDESGDFYYSALMSQMLNHNWHLGDPGDSKYQAGQTVTSFDLSYSQMTALGVYESPSDDVEITWTATDGDYDNIKLYCNIRSASPGDGHSWWQTPTSSYIFSVRLIEIIPV